MNLYREKDEGLDYGYIVPIHFVCLSYSLGFLICAPLLLFIFAYSAFVTPPGVAVRDDLYDSTRQQQPNETFSGGRIRLKPQKRGCTCTKKVRHSHSQPRRRRHVNSPTC